MAHAFSMHGQLDEWLGSIQQVLVHRLVLSTDTLFNYLVLQEGRPELVSAARFINYHHEATVVYIKVTMALFLTALGFIVFTVAAGQHKVRLAIHRFKRRRREQPTRRTTQPGRA
jgi:hypothetical protein